MAVNVRASNRGFSLLELTLSVALSTAFLLAFLAASRALFQGLFLAADGVRGPAEASTAMDQMTRDLEQATSFYASGSYLVDFQTPGGRIAYRLFAIDGASQDVVLERSLNNGAWTAIGPKRMIANYNPYGATFFGLAAKAPRPLFGYNYPLSTGEGPKTDIYMVLQANQTAPITYIRTKAQSVVMTNW